jgi:chromosome segregation ATPase
MAKETLLKNAKRAMSLKRRAEEVAPWDEYENEFAQFPDDLEELRARIENNKASLGCFRGDISIREEFQRVCAEIKEEERHLEQLNDSVSNGEVKINKIKETWHKDLKQVVEKIDHSFKEFFQDIGCAGEIKLVDDDEVCSYLYFFL